MDHIILSIVCCFVFHSTNNNSVFSRAIKFKFNKELYGERQETDKGLCWYIFCTFFVFTTNMNSRQNYGIVELLKLFQQFCGSKIQKIGKEVVLET